MGNDIKVFQIFKTGTHSSMSGVVLSFFERDLDIMISAYDPSRRAAPLCIGHPSDDLPSFGEVVGLFKKNGVLYAQARVNALLSESVRVGRYGPVSASFYHPQQLNNPVPMSYYLKHVGFLGAMPPAVKGLVRPSFSEPENAVCFTEGYELRFASRPSQLLVPSASDERSALHALAISHQFACPELSYAEAVNMSLGLSYQPGE